MSTDNLPKGVSIICYRDGHFSVSQRLSKLGHAGLWQFPGGHVEPGEEPLAAAVRELREETGIDLHPNRFFLIGITGPLVGYKGESYMGYRYGVVLDECEAEEPQHCEPDKHTPWEWVWYEKVLGLEMLQATVPYALAFALRQEFNPF